MAITDADAPVSPGRAPRQPGEGRRGSLRSLLRKTEFDARLLGMLLAMVVIWVGFHLWSGGGSWSEGKFLTSRNLWNLSVQFATVAIMATGMVLVIVSRNIDLSVGSMMGVIGMAMALLQADILPPLIGFDHPMLWVITVTAGIALGALIGASQGAIVAYAGVPSFIVTLGGLLVWSGVAFVLSNGRTVAPLDSAFRRLGADAIGGRWSWIVGALACVGVVALLANTRRQRKRFGFRLRPMWAEVLAAVASVAAILGGVYVLNRYFLPEQLARQLAEREDIPWPEGGLQISRGLAYPVLIAVGVALILTFVATRRRFGRYVYAIGGNPEAAELAGINTRATIVKVFTLMGALVAVAAAVQTARLNAAVVGLGTTAELYVIAAAVIGGTSLAGGIGTILGATLGALLMQSLQSGMVLIGADSPVQEIVVGIVLVLAVAIDITLRRRSE